MHTNLQQYSSYIAHILSYLEKQEHDKPSHHFPQVIPRFKIPIKCLQI